MGGSSLKINKLTLKKMGELAIQLIRKDMEKGIFQNDTSKHKYSETYARYKKNDMRKFGRGKKKIGKGERLKPYKGVSIVSNETRFVNLILTGNLRDRIKATDIENGARVLFDSKDTGKILGALDLKRDIVNLRKTNIDKVSEFLVNNLPDDIAKEIKSLAVQRNLKITIN